MAYKWRPNATQRKEFAEKMKDPDEKNAYEERKRLKHSFEGFKNKEFVPTQEQHDYCMDHRGDNELTAEQRSAMDTVMYGYSCSEKVHHDSIHIVNMLRRGEKINQ